MKLFTDLNQIQTPLPKAVITLGNFDGVHLGHQALFRAVIRKAAAIQGTAVAMTFEPHPLRVLNSPKKIPLITLYEQKVELIAASGIAVLICLPFTREFAAVTAHEFVRDILIGKIGMQAIIVGNDYNFGRNREGNIQFLMDHAAHYGYEVIVPEWTTTLSPHPDRVSSTRIRQLVADGAVEQAPAMLGRHYQVRGKVETGRNRGARLLGFPTANVNLHDELCPKTGVYAVTVEVDGQRHPGVANIGFSPTFEDHLFTVEVHILDFQENIYGKIIRVNFIQRLRDEKKFAGIPELTAQIHKDIASARQILVGHA
jgi:riboflavin kinase / FMN adenylyltransferase